MRPVNLWLHHAGYCVAQERHALRTGRKVPIRFHALFGVIRHPEHGLILFDTGYTPRFFDATRRLPGRIYALLTPVSLAPHETAAETLRGAGIAPEDVRHIVVSHLHADHVGGLRDFPNATFYVSRDALHLAQAVQHRPFRALQHGILPAMLPDDFVSRACVIEDFAIPCEDVLLGTGWDLFGDDALVLYALPGHAVGQMGLRLDTPHGKWFLVADALWLRDTLETGTLPHPATRLFFASWEAYADTVDRLRAYHSAHPDVKVVPTHCQATTLPLIGGKPLSRAL